MPRIIKDELPDIELVDNKSIGDRISEARKNMGITQQELADTVGIKRALLSEYETGRTRIYGEMIIRISMALHVSPEILLGFKIIQKKEEKTNSLRYTKRIKEIDSLPEHKIKNILRTIDDMIKANKD